MLHRIALTVLLLSLSAACAPWVPDTFPVTVALDQSLTDEQATAVMDGAQAWNDAVGARVFRVVSDDGRVIERDRVLVLQGDPGFRRLAATFRNHRWSEVVLESESNDPSYLGFDRVQIASHELGHVLGLHHDTLLGSTMHAKEHRGEHLAILPEHIEYVKALMD